MSDFRLISNSELNGIASAGNKFSKIEHAESVAKSRKGTEVIVEKDGLYSLYEPSIKDTASITKMAKQSNLKIIELIDDNNDITNISNSDNIKGVEEKVSNTKLKGIAQAGNCFKNFSDAESVAKHLDFNTAIVAKDNAFYLYNISSANSEKLFKGDNTGIDNRVVSVIKNKNTILNTYAPSVDKALSGVLPTPKKDNLYNWSYSSGTTTPNKNIAYTSNSKIMLNDKEFKISGMNVYDLANVAEGSQQELEKTLKTIADSGANTVRFWAFSSHSTDTFTHIFDTSKKMGLDLKFIPVLGNQWKDMEAQAGNFTKKDDWYKQGYKKDYLPHALETVRSMMNRDEVLMIELMNEPEANHSALKGFADTVSTAIKNEYKEYENKTGNKTAKHLISLGTLGGEGRNGMAGHDYKDLYSLPNIDVVTAHDYTLDDKQSKENTIAPLFKQYIDYAKQLNKPFFVGEIGVKVRKDGVENFGMPIRTNEKALQIMDTKMKLYNDKDIAGVLLWGPQPEGHNVDGAGFGFSYRNGDNTQSALKKIFSEIHP